MRQRDDIDINLPRASDIEKKEIPVWDAYIQRITIDGDLPDFIMKRIVLRLNPIITGIPQKFSGQLKGNIESILSEVEVNVYNTYGLQYSKLRVIREDYSLRITTLPGNYFDIW